LILTRPNNERAMEPPELETLAYKYSGLSKIVTTSSVAEALTKADTVSSKDSIILVTGSLYLVGETKQLLQRKI